MRIAKPPQPKRPAALFVARLGVHVVVLAMVVTPPSCWWRGFRSFGSAANAYYKTALGVSNKTTVLLGLTHAAYTAMVRDGIDPQARVGQPSTALPAGEAVPTLVNLSKVSGDDDVADIVFDRPRQFIIPGGPPPAINLEFWLHPPSQIVEFILDEQLCCVLPGLRLSVLRKCCVSPGM